MILPLFPNGVFGTYTGYLIGTLIGIAFGFVLERAGFGRARNLAAQFYLTDTRVLKVMFSAIVTAMAGMALLSGAGLLDFSKITVPETFLWPQLVGGLLLGVGFIVSGYCPGTGVVAAASGNLDGAVAIGGVMLGSLAFGLGYGPLEGFYRSGAMGVVRLDQLLGVPMAVAAAAVVAMAVGAFLGAEKLERIFSRRAGEAAPPSPRATKIRVFAGLGATAAIALVLLALPSRTTAAEERKPREIAPVELAKALVTSPEEWWIVDLRAPSGRETKRLPGATAMKSEDPKASFLAGLAPTRKLVVYGEGDVTALPEGVTRFAGELHVLKGGWSGWQREVLTPPALPEDATPPLVAEFRMREALHARFTGAISAGAAPVEIKPVVNAASSPRKGGGC